MAEGEHLKVDMASAAGPIPVVVYEAAVHASGTALYFRKSLLRALATAGVKARVLDDYEISGLSKFQIARDALDRLARAGQGGWRVQRRFIAELVNLTKPEVQVPDLEAGREALRELKRVAMEMNLLVDPTELEGRQRRATAEEQAQARSRREETRARLEGQFNELARLQDKQRRGYGLERILAGLFRLDELQYEASCKTETDQVDGTVTVDAFLYLVEARWREAQAVDSDLGGLLHKVNNRLDATRGLFVSMAGFRPEVVNLYRMRPENKLILMDGQDLAVVLEGRISMADALREKIKAAGVRGEPYLRLYDLLAWS